MVHSVLKPLLKRGALVALANWQVTLAQATADSLFKLLVATPVVGGVFLVALVIGAEPREMLSLEWRVMATTIITSLLSHPLVLLSFLLSLGTVVIGGSLFIFFVKAGTLAVLVKGERQTGEIGDSPLHLDPLAPAPGLPPPAGAGQPAGGSRTRSLPATRPPDPGGAPAQAGHPLLGGPQALRAAVAGRDPPAPNRAHRPGLPHRR